MTKSNTTIQLERSILKQREKHKSVFFCHACTTTRPCPCDDPYYYLKGNDTKAVSGGERQNGS